MRTCLCVCALVMSVGCAGFRADPRDAETLDLAAEEKRASQDGRVASFFGFGPGSAGDWKKGLDQPRRHAVAAALAASAALVQIDSADRKWQREIERKNWLPGSEQGKASDVGFFLLTTAAVAGPILFPPHPERGIGKRSYLWTNLWALGVNATVNGIVRGSNIRRRPSDSTGSFYSGHTAGSFAAATLLHREYGWKVGVPAYVIASMVGGYRIEADRHWPADVLFGAGAGIFFANLIYEKNFGDGAFYDRYGPRARVAPFVTRDRMGITFTLDW